MAQDPVARAIELVHVLTSPGPNPTAASEASNALQEIQLSSSGWSVGDHMLQSNVPSIRFYGAITFQIKLNRQARDMTADDAVYVRSRLLEALVLSAQSSDPAFVQKKLAGALATFFIKTPFPWDNALGSILEKAVGNGPIPHDKMNQISDQQKSVLYRLGTALAEDVGNEQGDTPYHKRIEDSMKTNNPIILSLLQQLSQSTPSEPQTIEAGLTCLVAWCAYGHRRWQYDPDVKYDLTNMVASVLPLLSRESAVARLALSAFTSILDQCPDVLSQDQLSAIWRHVSNALPFYVLDASRETLIEPNDDDIPLLKLVPALGSSMLSQLYDAPSDGTTLAICGILQRLPLATAYPGEDGDLISPVCSFLIDFAEHVTSSDESSDQDIDPRRGASLQILLGAIRFLVEVFRPAARAAFDSGAWSEDDYWSQTTEDMFEVMTETANIPGGQLSSYVISLVLRGVDSRDWADLDFALSAALAIRDGAGHNDMLGMVFNSSLLRMVSDTQSGMPLSTAKLVVRFVESYQEFFEHHTVTLLATLEQILIIHRHFSASQPDLSDQAARCVNALCSSSRTALLPSLSQLADACLAAMRAPQSTIYQREKIAGGLAFVIESLQNEDAKIPPLQLLLNFVQAEINESSRFLDQGDEEQGERKGVSALQVLAAIGKGLQRRAGETPSIGDVSTERGSEAHPAGQTWAGVPGQSIRRQILDCLNHVTRLQHSGDAIDATCAVLRVGLTEDIANPFTFGPEIICGFLEMMNMNMPRVEALLTTACAFISAVSRPKQEPGSAIGITKVYHAVARLLIQLGDPQSDPQVAQLCNDFLERLAVNHFSVLFGMPPEDLLSMFSVILVCLDGTAPMLKRASANLLSNVLDRSSSVKLSGLRQRQESVEAAARAEQVTEQLAPHIANVLMNQVRGQAQRSELDSICKVLRSFVATRGQSARSYLERAMGTDRSSATEDADGRAFLQKIVLLRGNLQTNAVVKEFWAACRGTVTSFDSSRRC